MSISITAYCNSCGNEMDSFDDYEEYLEWIKDNIPQLCYDCLRELST